jgi:3-oxoacyl-[acyl-carrier protein] reductase
LTAGAEIAVITGVSRGIGRATALALAQRGVAVALLGRDSSGHAQTVEDCAALTKTMDFTCDMADRDQVERAAAGVLDALGTPTVVIHNAAILERGSKVHELEPDAWDRLMAVNLRAPFLLTRALLPAMLDADRGRFLFISSVSGTIGCPEMAHYGASKWGLIGLAKALSEELRGTRLMSLAILPGSVDTDMLKKTPFPPDMSADEVADVIRYYALDAPPAVAGASVEIYG